MRSVWRGGCRDGRDRGRVVAACPGGPGPCRPIAYAVCPGRCPWRVRRDGSASRAQLDEARVVHPHPLGEDVVLALVAAEHRDERDDRDDGQAAEGDEHDDAGAGLGPPRGDEEERRRRRAARRPRRGRRCAARPPGRWRRAPPGRWLAPHGRRCGTGRSPRGSGACYGDDRSRAAGGRRGRPRGACAGRQGRSSRASRSWRSSSGSLSVVWTVSDRRRATAGRPVTLRGTQRLGGEVVSVSRRTRCAAGRRGRRRRRRGPTRRGRCP